MGVSQNTTFGSLQTTALLSYHTSRSQCDSITISAKGNDELGTPLWLVPSPGYTKTSYAKLQNSPLIKPKQRTVSPSLTSVIVPRTISSPVHYKTISPTKSQGIRKVGSKCNLFVNCRSSKKIPSFPLQQPPFTLQCEAGWEEQDSLSQSSQLSAGTAGQQGKLQVLGTDPRLPSSCRRQERRGACEAEAQRQTQHSPTSTTSPEDRVVVSPSCALHWITRVRKQRRTQGTGTMRRVGRHKEDRVNKSRLAVGFPARNLPLRVCCIFLDSTSLFLGGIINAEGNKEEKKNKAWSPRMEKFVFSAKLSTMIKEE